MRVEINQFKNPIYADSAVCKDGRLSLLNNPEGKLMLENGKQDVAVYSRDVAIYDTMRITATRGGQTVLDNEHIVGLIYRAGKFTVFYRELIVGEDGKVLLKTKTFLSYGETDDMFDFTLDYEETRCWSNPDIDYSSFEWKIAVGYSEYGWKIAYEEVLRTLYRLGYIETVGLETKGGTYLYNPQNPFVIYLPYDYRRLFEPEYFCLDSLFSTKNIQSGIAVMKYMKYLEYEITEVESEIRKLGGTFK